MATDRFPIKVNKSGRFKKDIKNLKKRYRAIEEDIQPLVEQLQSGETPGDRLTGIQYPVYKVRVQNNNINKGQSAGYRVIYYIQIPEAILLTKIYTKSDREDISNEEIEDIIRQYELEIEQQEKIAMLIEPSDREKDV
jgi:mRNA-degrading endonuclease RelE of RelBE toxin-antitoxin system